MMNEQFTDSRGTLVAVKIEEDGSVELQTLQQKLYFGKNSPMSKAIREMVLEQKYG